VVKTFQRWRIGTRRTIEFAKIPIYKHKPCKPISKVTLTFKEKIAAKKAAITAELEKCGIKRTRAFTDTFVSLGIYEHIEQYLSLLEHPHSDF
jgi:hypothetical protein